MVNGCRRKSPGCENCYAERLAATRLSKTDKYRGLSVYGQNGPRWTGESRLWAKDLDMPLRLKKPSRIFVADMGDLFYERVTNEEIAAVFGVMAAAPRHAFQVLTKRPERMLEWFNWVAREAATGARHPLMVPDHHAQRMSEHAALRRLDNMRWQWPLPNVWLGVSVEDQKRAGERIPLLLQTPAALRFLSVEPLLEPVQLEPDWLLGKFPPGGIDGGAIRGPKVDWCIIGGESGPGARPCHVNWIRSVVGQCRDAGTPVFVKQLGANYQDPENGVGGHQARVDATLVPAIQHLRDRKGGDMAEWPEDLRVRESPR